jgi:hypothetical protein
VRVAVSGETSACDAPLAWAGGQGEAEGRSSTGNRPLEPNAAAVLLHDTLTDGQANAASGVLFAAVQPLEKTEDSIGILRLDPNAVIGHGEYGPAVAFFGCNMDTTDLLTAVLYGVADQILK